MTKKIYRTANGKMVDLGALQLQNENVRAVGNMGVNARGDILDSRNRSINTRNQQVAKQYRKQTNVSDTPVAMNRQSAKPDPVPAKTKTKSAAKEQAKTVETPAAETAAPTGGLAAAIARAREIKQEPLDPAPSRNNNGVTKI